jgi:hypothetical protein
MYKSTFILFLFTYNYFVYNFNRSNSTSINISVSLYIKYSKLYDYGSDYCTFGSKGAYDSDGPLIHCTIEQNHRENNHHKIITVFSKFTKFRKTKQSGNSWNLSIDTYSHTSYDLTLGSVHKTQNIQTLYRIISFPSGLKLSPLPSESRPTWAVITLPDIFITLSEEWGVGIVIIWRFSVSIRGQQMVVIRNVII